jgi:hypothetical protein
VRGGLGLHVARPEQKWFFQVWMARSAELRLWLCGGTRWKLTLYFVKAFLRSSEHSLSRIWSLGANLFGWSWMCSVVQAVVSSLAWRVLRGLERMALLS